MNTSQKLAEIGQSIWYDNIQRRLLENGEMAGMIARGEIRGVTSNPSIFMNAITKSTDYDAGLLPLVKAGCTAEEIVWRLQMEDIQRAADLFRPLYNATNGGDGFVSLEVSPNHADDTVGTLAEVETLWAQADRPNVMIKIPATRAGIPAIRDAIADGVNVNITLIFSRARYAEVMEAFLTGLEHRLAAGKPIDSIASVASFFVSRVDTNVDKRLQAIIDKGGPQAGEAKELLGKAAIANARLASTSTKNPAYSDVLYVDELIGPDTINTVPPQTLVALLDHGVAQITLERGLDEAQAVMDRLAALGISMDEVTTELEREGVKAFTDAFRVLVTAMGEKAAVMV
ncbi:MAG: transaldolase [Anaerolineae bacterium]|nr:MAG: transaldolase [Anaerolineae bacterium]